VLRRGAELRPPGLRPRPAAGGRACGPCLWARSARRGPARLGRCSGEAVALTALRLLGAPSRGGSGRVLPAEGAGGAEARPLLAGSWARVSLEQRGCPTAPGRCAVSSCRTQCLPQIARWRNRGTSTLPNARWQIPQTSWCLLVSLKKTLSNFQQSSRENSRNHSTAYPISPACK